MSLHDRYMVDGLQTVEPDALTTMPGIDVVLSDDLDSMGFHTAEISGPTREAVLEYVRSNWGDDDRQWFDFYVDARIVAVSADDDEETADLQCACGAGPFDTREAIRQHAELWHPLTARLADKIAEREELNPTVTAHTAYDAKTRGMREAFAMLTPRGAAEIVARFNVEGFTAREIDALVGELSAQAERGDGHPDAEVIEITAPALPREGREILVHVNLTLPPDAPATADDVAREIEAALEIAAEDPSGNAPALQSADRVEIALAEEI